MSVLDSNLRDMGHWGDLLSVGDTHPYPAHQKPCREPHYALQSYPAANEMLEAAFWRLSKWTQDDIESAQERITYLIGLGLDLDTSIPEIEAFLNSLPSHDRRKPWTGLLALAVLYADAQDDKELLLSAGTQLLVAYAQYRRSISSKRSDALSKMIEEHLYEIPEITPKEIWEDYIQQAMERSSQVLVDYKDGLLTYESNGVIKDINCMAFCRRVQRVKKLQSK